MRLVLYVFVVNNGNPLLFGGFSGSALIKVGQCEQRLGSIEREFVNNANQCFVSPLQKFLDGEMKTISKERNLLQSKRLVDLVFHEYRSRIVSPVLLCQQVNYVSIADGR